MKNSEKYKTAVERDRALRKFCKEMQDCRICPVDKIRCGKGLISCHFIWLELEAEEAKT